MSALKDKVAIVTGGSRGIGRAIVLMLAENGCHVAFNYHSDEKSARLVVEEASRFGVKVQARRVDIQDHGAVKGWIEDARGEFGRIDILVNNAGIINDKALLNMSEEDWRQVIDTNLTGMFHACKACIFTFLKQKQGCIINISSVAGVVGLARQTNYSAAKGGVNAFTKALAKEVAAYGIRVNAVAPGYIDTDMLKNVPPELQAKIKETIPLGRLGRPEEVAACVKFLLSETAEYITGQVVTLDGGLGMR